MTMMAPSKGHAKRKIAAVKVEEEMQYQSSSSMMAAVSHAKQDTVADQVEEDLPYQSSMMASHAKQHVAQEEDNVYLRAMSLPDMTELADIVALDDVVNGDDDDRDENDSDPSSVQNHPTRLFSLGLHRSMSMPRQQQVNDMENHTEDEKKQEEDDFYFPDDESELSVKEKESFLPQFYSNETLARVISPSGKKMVPSPTIGKSIGNKPKSSIAKRILPHQTNEQVAPDADKELMTGSLREAAAKKTAQREAALSSLSAFFGGISADADADTTNTSPLSVIQFPTAQESNVKERSESLPCCSHSNAAREEQASQSPTSVSPPRRSIFAKTHTEPSSSSDFEFKMLQGSDRTTSMPAKLPSSKMPRKPSLKKVSSFLGNPKNETADGEMKPSVSFSNLQIREYDVTIGDNPSCSYGVPISLGWDYQETEVVPLEKYERARSNKFPRRKSRQLVLSYNVRKYMLLKTAGYTKAELREAMEEVKRIKHERKMTDMMLPLDEVMEGVIDHVKGMFQQQKK